MSVTLQGSRAILLGNGVTQTFSANFELPAAADLTLWRQDTNSSTTNLTSNLYTLAGVGSPTGFTISYLQGGTTPIQTGQSLIAIREVPYTQPTVLSNQGPYDATAVMDALDNLAFQIQQLETQAGLAVSIPLTDAAIPPTPDAAARANSFLFFDVNGNPTTASSTAGLPATIAVGSTTSNTASAAEILFTGSAVVSVTNSLGISTVTLTGGPGGSNGQLQYDNSGVLGGVTAMSGDATFTIPAGVLTLVTSGVSAATYTNATVTVDAKGRVTSAANGSSGAGAIVLISTQTPTGTGVVTFSSLGAYNSLMITALGRSDAAAADVAVAMTFNSDTGSNYDYQRLIVQNTSVTSDSTMAGSSIEVGAIPAASAPSGLASTFEINISDYGGTTFQKTVTVEYILKTGTSTGDLFEVINSGYWRNTAAITRIDITLSSGNWVAGSRVSLYGVQA
jgi:hypothetical protein